jgi:hypothetical protein
MSRFELYRYTHEDGSAKDWAYCDQGNGLALIRWGPAGQLRSQQEKPLAVAYERAHEKRRKGYQPLGQVQLDERGRVQRPSRASIAAGPSVRVTQTPIDRSALLGPGDGFYF